MDMIKHNSFSENKTIERLHLIREYVQLQNKLVSKAVSELDSDATEFDFEDSLGDAVTIDGVKWAAKAHGLGVMFTNLRTNLVVDVHVGFIDAPTAFDAWRLVQYAESKQGTNEDLKSWQETLNELGREGVLEQHGKYEGHYVIKG